MVNHGGWPRAKETAALLLKPNVYVDFSSLAFLLYPRELSEVIRGWLEMAPQKVLFGIDAFDLGYKLLGWEELAWIGNSGARQALALALTGMMQDGEITPAEAVELAQRVLRQNAIDLCRLKTPPSD